MWRNAVLKASLLVLMVSLCVGVPIVNAEGVLLSWTSPTTKTLFDVFMVSANDGWAVGRDGTIIRWDGTAWSTVASPTTSWLYSVFMVSSSDGWAVGDGGTIIRWDGASWLAVLSPTTQSLRSVFMVGADDGWAVGDAGTIIQWDGTEWIPEFSLAMLMPLLISLTLVAVILAKTASKKRRKPAIPSKTRL